MDVPVRLAEILVAFPGLVPISGCSLSLKQADGIAGVGEALFFVQSDVTKCVKTQIVFLM